MASKGTIGTKGTETIEAPVLSNSLSFLLSYVWLPNLPGNHVIHTADLSDHAF